MIPRPSFVCGCFLTLALGADVRAQAVAVPVRVAWAALGVDVRLTLDPIEVRGQTFSDARRDLDRVGPRSVEGSPRHGMTIYSLLARWQVERTPEACRVRAASVRADIRVRIPAWQDARDARVQDYETWRAFRAAITAHEHAHRDLALAAAHRLAGGLRAMEASTCPALDRNARALTRRLQESLDADQAALDGSAGGRAGMGARGRDR